MKTKWIFWIVAVIMIFAIFFISHGADRFYYGSYNGEEYASVLRDSLRFNIVRSDASDAAEIQSIAQAGLRAIVANLDNTSPLYWSRKSHYTLWEAEGLPGSWVNLEYDGGILVDDASASGGKAMKFTGPGTPNTIQTGPGYEQEPNLPGDTAIIEYTAEFRLKRLLTSPLGPMAPGPPKIVKVCSLKVVETVRDTILKDTLVYGSDFGAGGAGPYKTFELVYTVPPKDSVHEYNIIEFQIYWFGNAGALYIDYVKVYDEYGEQLMSGFRDSAITDYVSQGWVHDTIPGGDTVVYRWYLRDEPQSIDLFRPTAYIDSLLKEVSQERVGIQAFNYYRNPTMTHEYLLRQDPTDFCADIYPMKWLAQETTGVEYQDTLSDYTGHLNFVKTKADSLGKDFWLVAEAFTDADTFEGTCDYPLIYWGDTSWCPTCRRDPSQYELRLQTFLGLCYGADAILYFRYSWWVDSKGYLITGLYDTLNNYKTHKWREIRDFTSPRVEKLGPIFNQLEWQGACLDDEVGFFVLRDADTSYIDSITASDEPHWVEVGFFTADTGQYTDYFILVNRECLESEADDYYVFFTDEPGPYRIRDMYTDSVIAVVDGFGGKFRVHLEAGEGRLFRLEPRNFTSHGIDVPQDSS